MDHQLPISHLPSPISHLAALCFLLYHLDLHFLFPGWHSCLARLLLLPAASVAESPVVAIPAASYLNLSHPVLLLPAPLSVALASTPVAL